MTDLTTLLRKIVIAWDADQTEEFDVLLARARKVLGLKLHSDAEDILEQMQTKHYNDETDDAN